jgi:peptidoglycan/xylan/chitin deacetylase (PgdA/CDA1 family)
VKRPWFGDVYRYGRDPQGRYALTFDDGPMPGATEVILDHLKAAGAPATIFVIGRYAEANPDLIRRMYAEGHTIANHTWEHSRWGMWCGPRYWRKQITRTDDAIEKIIGRRPGLFRPPFGVRTPVNHYVTRNSAHAVVMWTRRALDGIPTTAERIELRLVRTAKANDILLLHDGREPAASSKDASATVNAVPAVIRGFAERGLKPAALHELIHVPPYQ